MLVKVYHVEVERYRQTIEIIVQSSSVLNACALGQDKVSSEIRSRHCNNAPGYHGLVIDDMGTEVLPPTYRQAILLRCAKYSIGYFTKM